MEAMFISHAIFLLHKQYLLFKVHCQSFAGMINQNSERSSLYSPGIFHALAFARIHLYILPESFKISLIPDYFVSCTPPILKTRDILWCKGQLYSCSAPFMAVNMHFPVFVHSPDSAVNISHANADFIFRTVI